MLTLCAVFVFGTSFPSQSCNMAVKLSAINANVLYSVVHLCIFTWALLSMHSHAEHSLREINTLIDILAYLLCVNFQEKPRTVRKRKQSLTYKFRRRTMHTTRLWRKWRDCCNSSTVTLCVVTCSTGWPDLYIGITVQMQYCAVHVSCWHEQLLTSETWMALTRCVQSVDTR